ncbi:MAG: M56 family metallopeptidase [Pirellulaceae bacterium]
MGKGGTMPDVLYLVGWNHLVAALMAMAVWLACRTRILTRRPAVCHGLWLLVLLKLVTPPIVPLPILPAMVAAEPSTPGIIPPERIASATLPCAPLPCVTPPSPWRNVCFALLGASLLVSCALWIAAARQFVRVRRLLRGSAVAAGRADELLREVSQRFNLRTAVKLQLVDAPIAPMLWAEPGRPAIVLPRSLARSLGDDGLRSIIAHELAHFVRRDHWVNSFALLVATLFWWNPLVWLARRQLSAAAEASCDAMALARLPGSRKSYAETLLRVVDSVTRATPLRSAVPPLRSALGIPFGESHSLRRRFEMIADAHVKARMTLGGWMLLLFGCAALTFPPPQAEGTLAAATSLLGEPAAETTLQPAADQQLDPFATYCCPS